MIRLTPRRVGLLQYMTEKSLDMTSCSDKIFRDACGLVTAGYVRRETACRATLLLITPKGRRALAKVKEVAK